METTIITAKRGQKWVSEIKDFGGYLPENCILDKGETGCGATTLAIDNDRPTIIAVPSVNLIHNKMEQKPHLFGVWGDIGNGEIESYIRNTDRPLKIMATYDAIPRIVKVAGAEIYDKAFLLVDEFHRLLFDYSFRNDAVTGLLQHAPRFINKTYMSATPIEHEFLLDELQDMPITRIVWPDKEPLQIRLWQETSPFATVAGLCRNAVKQDVDFNLHFFMNTTTGIGRALRYANVPPELVKNVCRPDDENREKLAGYSIDSPTGQPRKINFYTSTAFEGCDIYDPKGRIYIVSDGSIKHTMQDVSTSIRQIAGRIRDTRYKEITHLFSQSRYGKDVDYKKFQEATDYEIDRAKRWLKHRDTADEDLRDGIYFHSQYINKKTMQFDNNRPKLDMMNYRNWNQIYGNPQNLITEYKRTGAEITSTAKHNIRAERLESNAKAKIPFGELFEDYARFRADGNMFKLDLVARRNPLVVESYDKLGVRRVRELGYNQTQIKRELLKKTSDDMAYKITKMIQADIPQGTAVPMKVVKERLQNIYDELGIMRTAKAADISEWFDWDRCYRNVDGRNTACMVIIRPHMVVRKIISANRK